MIGREGLIGPWQKGCTMRRAKPSIGPKVQGYRNFAGVTLAVAALVALGGNDFGSTADAASAPVLNDTRPKPRSAIRPATTLAVKAQAFAPDEIAPDAEQPEAEQDAAADKAQSGRSDPQLPGQRGVAEKGPVKQADARPRPEQIDRMIAASRARSGGVDQGDEPLRVS